MADPRREYLIVPYELNPVVPGFTCARCVRLIPRGYPYVELPWEEAARPVGAHYVCVYCDDAPTLGAG